MYFFKLTAFPFCSLIILFGYFRWLSCLSFLGIKDNGIKLENQREQPANRGFRQMWVLEQWVCEVFSWEISGQKFLEILNNHPNISPMLSSQSEYTFRHQLKTWFFKKSFPDIITWSGIWTLSLFQVPTLRWFCRLMSTVWLLLWLEMMCIYVCM